MANTLITVHVREETKKNLQEHLGEVSFKDLLKFAEALFENGDIYVEDGNLFLNCSDEQQAESATSEEHPLIVEFKSTCSSVSMDWEYGMRKAINALKRREI